MHRFFLDFPAQVSLLRVSMKSFAINQFCPQLSLHCSFKLSMCTRGLMLPSWTSFNCFAILIFASYLIAGIFQRRTLTFAHPSVSYPVMDDNRQWSKTSIWNEAWNVAVAQHKVPLMLHKTKAWSDVKFGPFRWRYGLLIIQGMIVRKRQLDVTVKVRVVYIYLHLLFVWCCRSVRLPRLWWLSSLCFHSGLESLNEVGLRV